jgi:hypothetical protein
MPGDTADPYESTTWLMEAGKIDAEVRTQLWRTPRGIPWQNCLSPLKQAAGTNANSGSAPSDNR